MSFLNINKNRRSINFFDTEKDVSESQLTQIIETSANTPSSFNLQPWSLIVLRASEEKEKLKSLAWDQEKVVEAPVVLIVLADKNGWKEGNPTFEKNWEEMLKSGAMQLEQREWFLNATDSLYNWNNDANLAFAAKNTGFFAMSFMYAAIELGLHTHPMDGFDHEAVRKEFRIPENYWVPLLLAVGHKKPGLKMDPPKWRKSYNDIVVSF